MVPLEPPDPIYDLQLAFKADPRPHKLNLSIGTLPMALNAVKQAEARVIPQHAYLPIAGHDGFCAHMARLVGLPESVVVQAVGGTAALYIAGTFAATFLTPQIWIPDPTWINHRKLFEACGLTVHTYPHSSDITPLLDAIKTMPPSSLLLLQASCYNPTGIDPTLDEWQQISAQAAASRVIPLFDVAYAGLGHGLQEDTEAIRLFHNDGHALFVALSCSKSFGLYNDRIGALLTTYKPFDAVRSQLKRIIRTIYSSPPAHGACIIDLLLNDPELTALWKEELTAIRASLATTRKALHVHTTGLFAMPPLTADDVLALRANEAIYLCDDGRINLAAIPHDQLERVKGHLYAHC